MKRAALALLVCAWLATAASVRGQPAEAAAPAPQDPAQIELHARILLHVGSAAEARTTLDDFYGDAARTPGALLLEAESWLLEHRLGQTGTAGDEAAPSELVDRQLAALDRGLQAVERGLLRLDALRAETSAERYQQFRSQLLVSRAELLMEQGDVRFKLEGASLARQAAGGASAASSLVKYGEARQSLYEALLMAKSPLVQDLADRIDARVAWLTAGRFYGGIAFYTLDPFIGDPDPNSPTPLGRLNRYFGDTASETNLKALYDERARSMTEAKQYLLAQKQRVIDKLDATKYRRQVRRQELMARLADLEKEIAALALDQGDERLAFLKQQQQVARERAFAITGLEQDLLSRKEALESRREILYAALADEVGGVRAMATVAQVNGLAGAERVKAFTAGASAARTPHAGLRAALSVWQRESNADATRLGRLARVLQQAQDRKRGVEARIAQTTAQLEAATRRVENARLEQEMERIEQEIRDREVDFIAFMTKAEGEAESFKQKLAKQAADDIKRRIAASESIIDRVSRDLDTAKSFIDEAEKFGRAIEVAIGTAQATITAAAAIPQGIIAGVASGTLFDAAGSVIEAAKTGIDLVRSTQETWETIQQGRVRIAEVQEKLDRYADALKGLQQLDLEKEYERQLDAVKAKQRHEELAVKRFIAERKKAAQAIVRDMTRTTFEIEEFGRQEIEAKLAEVRTDLLVADNQIEIEKGQLASAGNDTSLLFANAEQLLAQVTDVEAQVADLGAQAAEVRKQKAAGTAGAAGDAGTPPEVAAAEAAILASLSADQLRIQRDLDAVAAEIAALDAAGDAPADAAGFTDALEVLGRGSSARALSYRYSEALADANRILFDYANWLYFMLGSEEALAWAVVSSSHEEAALVKRKLDALRERLVRSTKRHPRVIAVEIDVAKDLPAARGAAAFTEPTQARMWGDDALDELWFSVDTGPDSLSTRDRTRDVRVSLEGGGDARHLMVTPESDLGSLRFMLDVGQEEAGARQVLWDVWVVPHWKGDGGRTRDYAVGIEPVGPTGYRSGGHASRMPVVQVGNAALHGSASRKRDDVAAQLRDVKGFVDDADQSILSGRFYGSNYGAYLGRGMENTWRLVAPSVYNRGRGDYPSLRDLEKIEIWFGYIPFSEASTGRATLAAAGPRRPEWLAGLGAEPGDPASLAARYREDLTGDAALRVGFELGPAGRLARLALLRAAAAEVPRFGQIAAGGAPLSAEQKSFVDKPERLTPELSQEARAALERARGKGGGFEQTTREIAREEITRRVLSTRVATDEGLGGEVLVDAVNLKLLWDTRLRPLLEGDRDAQGFVQAVAEARAKLEAVAATARQVYGGLEPIAGFLNRLNYDLDVVEGQERFARDLGALVASLVAPGPVRAQLLEWDGYVRYHASPDVWLAPLEAGGRNPDPRGLPAVRRHLSRRMLADWTERVRAALR